jgi:hypothetical protein
VPEPLDPECLFGALADAGVDYVLIGGLAGVLHGSPAMTNDADIVPSRARGNLVRLGEALRDLDARVRSVTEPDGVVFDPHPDLLAGMQMLNTTTRCGDLDLTFEPSGTRGYDDLVSRAVEFRIGGLRVLVAALDDVIRSKEAADRPKDHAVLPLLHALRQEIAQQADDRTSPP